MYGRFKLGVNPHIFAHWYYLAPQLCLLTWVGRDENTFGDERTDGIQ